MSARSRSSAHSWPPSARARPWWSASGARAKPREVPVSLADLDKARKVQDAVAQVLNAFGLNEFSSTPPLTILSVADDSRARDLGLMPRNQILAVGSRNVKDLEDFVWALAAERLHEGQPVEITVSRNGTPRKVHHRSAHREVTRGRAFRAEPCTIPCAPLQAHPRLRRHPLLRLAEAGAAHSRAPASRRRADRAGCLSPRALLTPRR